MLRMKGHLGSLPDIKWQLAIRGGTVVNDHATLREAEAELSSS